MNDREFLTDELENGCCEVKIVSGEGTGKGTVEIFDGKRTLRALDMRLKKERCGGDRWAYALLDLSSGTWRYRCFGDCELMG